jgi:hypothetical protein
MTRRPHAHAARSTPRRPRLDDQLDRLVSPTQEVRVCEAHDKEAKRGGLVVSPTISIEVLHACVPPTSIRLEDQRPVRNEPVHPLRLRVPGRGELPHDRRTSRDRGNYVVQQRFEFALRRDPPVLEPFVNQRTEQADAWTTRSLVGRAPLLQILDGEAPFQQQAVAGTFPSLKGDTRKDVAERLRDRRHAEPLDSRYSCRLRSVHRCQRSPVVRRIANHQFRSRDPEAFEAMDLGRRESRERGVAQAELRRLVLASPRRRKAAKRVDLRRKPDEFAGSKSIVDHLAAEPS